MATKPYVMHLKVAIGPTEYVLGTLSVKMDSREMSYHVALPEDSPFTQFNIDAGRHTDPVHHLTWHERVINLKTLRRGDEKGREKIIRNIPQPGGTFIPTTPQLKPVLVETFIFDGDPVPLCHSNLVFADWKGSDECLVFSMHEPANFSLAVMLVPSDWPTWHIMQNAKVEIMGSEALELFYLRAVGHDIGRLHHAFGDWDILVFSTPFAEPVNTPSLLKGPVRMLNYERPLNGIGNLLKYAKSNPFLPNEILSDLHHLSALQSKSSLKIVK